MSIVLIANIISFVGSVLMVSMGLIKRKKNVLIVQCFQCGLMGIGNLMLGGMSGFFVDMLTIARNCISFKREFTTPFKLGFIGILVVLNIFTNKLGIIGWLPVIAASLFTWFLDTKKDVVIKVNCIAGQIMWAIYDIIILNYSAFVFDLFTLVSNGIGIIRLQLEKKKA